MAILDVFSGAAFEFLEMTDAVARMPYVPGQLGRMGIFGGRGTRTTKLAIDQKNFSVHLIPTSERGAPRHHVPHDKADTRDIVSKRIAIEDNVTSEEVQDQRQYGTDNTMLSATTLTTERLSVMNQSMELTHEHMRLGMVDGVVLDANGTTELYDWYDIWGQTDPGQEDYDLGNTSPTVDVRLMVRHQRQQVIQASGQYVDPNTPVVAICGTDFYNKFVGNAAVSKAYDGWEANRAYLLDRSAEYSIFNEFTYGGVRWVHYRGTDDEVIDPGVGVTSEATVGMTAVDMIMFPLLSGIFEMDFAPNETLADVNQPGRRVVAQRSFHPAGEAPTSVKLTLDSYPFPINRRPEVVRKGTTGSCWRLVGGSVRLSF